MSPADEARSLVQVVQAIAGAIDDGEASLIWQHIAVCSDDPDTFVLARLLGCFGAEVTFLCPAMPKWAEERHRPLLAALCDELARTRPDLDVETLATYRQGNFTRATRFQVEVIGDGDSPACAPFDRVIAIDVIPPEPAGAVGRLDALVPLARVGADIDLVNLRTAPPAETDEALRRASARGPLGLSSRQPEIEADRPAELAWHLEFVRLDGPLSEYPVSDETSGGAVMVHARARLEFATSFVDGRDVLEAGCGTAIGARLFVENGARSVVAIDASDEALGLARETTNDERIELRRVDLNRALPFDDASFDVVICVEVLEHIHEHETAVAEFRRVLRPGGTLVISVPELAFEDEWTQLNRYQNIHHVRVPANETFRALLGPFDDVRFVHELDVAGTVFLAEDDTTPTGRFVTDAPLETTPREVIAAVCRVAPLADGSPPEPVLRLFGNDLATRLAAARHASSMRSQLLTDRRRLWADANRRTTDALATSAHAEALARRLHRLRRIAFGGAVTAIVAIGLAWALGWMMRGGGAT